MNTTAWKDLNHKVAPERREEIKREAVAELDRMGFAALRKARRQTQVELADKLGIDQAGVSAIENRSDLLLSTLAKYVRALGGNVEIRAVFPEASFNLEPLLSERIQEQQASVAIGKRAGAQRETPARPLRRVSAAAR